MSPWVSSYLGGAGVVRGRNGVVEDVGTREGRAQVLLLGREALGEARRREAVVGKRVGGESESGKDLEAARYLTHSGDSSITAVMRVSVLVGLGGLVGFGVSVLVGLVASVGRICRIWEDPHYAPNPPNPTNPGHVRATTPSDDSA